MSPTSHSILLPFSMSVAMALLWGCGNDNDATTLDGAPNAGNVTLAVVPHPINTLMAIATVRATSPGSVAVHFAGEEGTEHITRSVPIQANETVEIVTVGMRADTEYALEARLELGDGREDASVSVRHTTGALPSNAPAVRMTEGAPNESSGGITIFSHGSGRRDDPTAPLYFGADEEGEIVWYLHGTTVQNSDGVARGLDNGNLLVFLTNSVAEVTPAGEIVTTYELGEQSFHHDALILPNGNALILGTETAAIANASSPHDGENITYDVVLEVDPASGSVEWAWSAAEHLDTARFPSTLSERTSAQGGLDWSHANALHYLPEEDSVLVSSRSQSWVIKIDRATSDIQWIFGAPDGVLDSSFEPNFFSLSSGTFPTAQHAPFIAQNGDLVLFDNRNDSAGSTLNSRAVRYSLDDSTYSASQVWEYVTPKYAPRLGDVDELSNGSILVCAGGGNDETAYLSEVDQEGSLKWQLTIDAEVYRAERISWDAFR